MYHKHTLKPAVWHVEELEFELDTDAGAIRGRDARKVLQLVDAAIKEGGIVGHPYPTSYEIKDPLHDLSEMSVLLGVYWQLDDNLSAAYPKPDEDDLVYEIDSDGKEHIAAFQPLE